jgi:PAS domain S-box-containing protein
VPARPDALERTAARVRPFAAWIVLFVCLALTVAAWRLAASGAVAERATVFDRHVRLVSAAVAARLDAYETLLRGAAGVASRSSELRRAAWQRLAADVELETRFPDLVGLGIAEYVRSEELEGHVARVRAEGFPEYRVHPDGDRAEYAVVAYVEPLEANRAVFGFDTLSDPPRRVAVERARDTGEPAMTPRLHLMRDPVGEDLPAFGIFHPVYRDVAAKASVEARRAAFVGFVSTAFRLRDLMAHVLSGRSPAIDLVVRDASDGVALFESAPPEDRLAEPRFRSVTSIAKGGREWRLHFTSRRPIEAGLYGGAPLAALLVGLAASALLFTLVRTQGEGERRALGAADLATARLRDREAHLRAVVESEPECVKVVSIDGRLLEMNPAGLAAVEADGFEQIAGSSVYDIVHPADRERYRALHDRVAAGGAGTATFRVIGLRGTLRWMETSSVPLLDAAGTITGVLSVTHDTARKRTEDTLEAVFRAVPDLFFLVSADDTLIDYRGGTPGDLHAPPETFLGRRFADVLPAELARRIGEHLVRVRATGEPSAMEYHLSTPGGDSDFEGRFLPLGNGDVLLVARNITEFKRTQAALEASEERYRRIVEMASEGIWSADAANVTTFVNPSMARMLGYEVSEVVGRDAFEFMGVEVHALARDYIARLSSGEPLQVEFPFRRRDGRLLWTLVSARPIIEGGRYAGVLSVVTDITERRLLEARLRRAEKMEALGTLAGGIAHDFNNILGSIVGFTELARLERADDPRRAEALDNVLEAGRRAKALVEQIMAFSHAREAEREPVDLAQVVTGAVKLVRVGLPSSVTIATSIAPDLPPVLATESEMHQVVVNLATNGAQAMGDRPGRLDVRVDAVTTGNGDGSLPPELPPGRWVRLRIRDDGFGMDAVTLERIFEPFFTTKTPGTGTGLGLAVVHGIVTRHGGTIIVRSRSGEGSTFDVYLPAHEGTVAAPPPEATAPPRGHGEHVLFVDDDAPIAELGRRILGSLGYRVTAVTDPAEALALVRREPAAFDVVVTDVTMPTLPGTELAREILRIRVDLPVLLNTGYGGSVTTATARALGVRGLLAKPNTMASLGQAVHDALGGAA